MRTAHAVVSLMHTTDILAALDAEIAKLTHARTLLTGEPVKRGPGRPPKAAKAFAVTQAVYPQGRAPLKGSKRANWAKLRRGE